MASLKELRNRISSVKSTQKITSAMKMVAASKLRRAQEQAEAGRPFSERMERMLASLATRITVAGQGPRLMTGTGKDDIHLLVVVTSDRGLAGGFNSQITREARKTIRALKNEGKTVKLLTIGRKGRDNLRRDFSRDIVHSVIEADKPKLSFSAADAVADKVLELFDAGEFDVCTVVYNRFQSTIAQVPTVQQVIPVALPEAEEAPETTGNAIYEFEPDEETILRELLPRNLAIQIYKTLLESAAGEQAARMTAMDNATRNAGDMINKLTLTYNRTRQATITKELIEIISGAEAI
ncbi:F0F1 ATP synthase subunit gamma [Inquilinus sp. CAU 1745]|uniref:F0F1 ATP synthase subunit gamma n=1 Tax=Inquilinus sp. CAU 1745 TaxID=3140369 RepID=UPI00325A5FBE